MVKTNKIGQKIDKVKLVGRWCVNAAGIVILVLFLWMLFLFLSNILASISPGLGRKWTNRLLCQNKLDGLGKAFSLYAHDNDGKYPTADKWCDLLIKYADVIPRQFICISSDAIRGESSYALNKNIVGMKVSDVPSDVVLLFETNFGKDPNGRQEQLADRDYYRHIYGSGTHSSSEKVYRLRWNQCGGPEIITFNNHVGKGCNVLFNDGNVEFIRARDIGKLRWKVEENEN